ncbi:MAG: hypothetical protein LUE93_16960 [Bacteroides sp.]|nr:hypothetical protein [Bacteroides sp.]
MITEKRTHMQNECPMRQTLMDYLGKKYIENPLSFYNPAERSNRYKREKREAVGYIVLMQPTIFQIINPTSGRQISARQTILALIACLEDLNNLAPVDLSDFTMEELLEIATELYLFSRESGHHFINEEIRHTIEELEKTYYGYGEGILAELIREIKAEEKNQGIIDIELSGMIQEPIHLVIIETYR